MKKSLSNDIKSICILTSIIFFGVLSCKKSGTTPTPPKADFSFQFMVQGSLPAQVSFANASTNAITYSWRFGDGNSSTAQNPSNNYNSIGSFNVTLIATGDGGIDSITKTVAISLAKPTAAFSFTQVDSGAYPTHVNFIYTGKYAASFRWIFDNGDSSTAQNPSDSFFTTKAYNVKLVVASAGGTDSLTQTVNINIFKPKASFIATISDNGNYPTHINFNNTSSGATAYKWTFGNGDMSTLKNPIDSFFAPGNYNVKLVATGPGGSDSVTNTVSITINKPTALFSFINTTQYQLPYNISITNASVKAASYLWDFGDGTAKSSSANPTHSYTVGGIYTLTLTVTNPGGSATATQQVYVSPYPVSYTNFNNATLNLYAWEGKKVAIQSRNLNLNATSMFAWAKTMDSVYNFYKACTGQEPSIAKIINNHTTVSDVPSTCGAGCGYLGATGIELQNTYFDNMYNGINNNNQYDQANFYEFGRNFWFYGNKIAYTTNDPITTGYAVFMRFKSLDATGVAGGPFNGNMTYAQFETAVINLVDQYTANTTLNWNNTLGANAGVPGQFGGATDLFASFCFRLVRDYGGNTFMNNIWKEVGKRPNAITTQDAVDNFILAACTAANKNLTNLFMNTWRWPMSTTAQTAATQYP